MKVNLIGKRFGRLLVIHKVGKDYCRNILWKCRCDCGAITIQRTNTLHMKLAVSCGCYSREINSRRMKNQGNPMWKGDAVKRLTTIHEWVRLRKPKPKLCERCHENPPIDLANVSGKYLRDVADYEWLCRKCHMIGDGRINRRAKNGCFARA